MALLQRATSRPAQHGRSGAFLHTDPEAPSPSLTGVSIQLVFRIICAYAAQSCLPDQLAGNSRRGITHEIKTEFETYADSIGIWRQTDPDNLVPLFLGYKAKETEDLTAEEAAPYLEAAIAQWRRLVRRESPASRQIADSLPTSLRWSLVVADCYGAAERRHTPLL